MGPDLTLVAKYTGPIMLTFGIVLELIGCFIIFKICDIDV